MTKTDIKFASEEPVADVVSVLERALEDAKTGKLRNVVVAATCIGNTYFTIAGFEDGGRLLAHLFMAQLEVAESMSKADFLEP